MTIQRFAKSKQLDLKLLPILAILTKQRPQGYSQPIKTQEQIKYTSSSKGSKLLCSI